MENKDFSNGVFQDGRIFGFKNTNKIIEKVRRNSAKKKKLSKSNTRINKERTTSARFQHVA